MSKAIENDAILMQLRKNKTRMEKLMHLQAIQDKKVNKLQKDNLKFVALMDAEYGLGGWQNVDANEETFVSKDEFMGQYYLIHNPALRQEVKLDDVDLKIDSGDESGAIEASGQSETEEVK